MSHEEDISVRLVKIVFQSRTSMMLAQEAVQPPAKPCKADLNQDTSGDSILI